MNTNARKVTNDVISAVEDGFLDWETVARAALNYLSEDDVEDMAEINGWNILIEDEEEDDEEFWVLVYKEKDSKEEITERYDDFDDVRSDFKYLSEQNSEDYEYVVLQKVTESQIDGETIEEISRYENKENNYGKLV